MFCRRLALVCGALCGVMPLWSQVDTGSIAGTVRDSSAAVLTQAQVVIENSGTGQKFDLLSNAEGIYVSPPLRSGEYVVTVSAPGFERAAKHLQLDVSQRAVIDFD